MKKSKLTLSEISKMNPSDYTVHDFAMMRGRIRTWNDKIEIIIDDWRTPEAKNFWSIKTCKRRAAYKYGLCFKAN